MALAGIYPVIGKDARYEEINSLALFNVGRTSIDNQGGLWKYVKASGAITKHNIGFITSAAIPLVVAASTTNIVDVPYLTGTPHPLCIPQISIPDTYFGWVWCGGPGCGGIGYGIKGRIAAGCLAENPLYLTSTAGRIDDAVVAVSMIAGLKTTVDTTPIENIEVFSCTYLTVNCQDS